MKECGLARTALPLLQEVQPILSRNALAYVTLCQAFSKMGQNDKALEVLNQGARNIEITDIQGRILISQEYRMFAEWDKSQEQMQEAYAQAPNDANLGAMVGSAMIDSNKIDEARSFLAELVSKFPQSSEAHRQYAYALYDFNLKGNNLKQAEHHFLTAVRLDPQNRQAWRQLGEMYQRTHRVRPTAYAFTHALQLNPHDGDARMTVSRSYGLLGLDMEPVMSWQNRRRFAIRDQTEYFMRTMRYQNPNDPNSLLMLPRHYAKYGQYEKCFHAIQSLYIPYGTMPAVREEVEKLYREIKLPFPLLPTPLKDKGSVLRTPSGFQG